MANPTDVNRVTSTLLSIALVLTYSIVIAVGGHGAAPAGALLFVLAGTDTVLAWIGVGAAIAHCFIRLRTTNLAVAWLMPLVLVVSLRVFAARSEGLVPITVVPFVASLIAFAIRYCLLAVPKP
jgi:hypothetical protein